VHFIGHGDEQGFQFVTGDPLLRTPGPSASCSRSVMCPRPSSMSVTPPRHTRSWRFPGES
jgi:hypothetical protein